MKKKQPAPDLFCRRWNFETTDELMMVCYDHHEKGERCKYERMTPREAVALIESLRSEVLRLKRLEQ